jgi:hypothetical protein
VSEEVFLSRGDVQVTKSRVVIGGQTYPMTGITVVRTVEEPPKRTGSIILGVIGVIIALWGIAASSAVGIIVGLIVLGLAVFLWMNSKAVYHLSFGTAGNQSQVLSSPNVEDIRRVANAINEAIIARG